MKLDQIKVGEVYGAKVSGSVVRVRVLRIEERYDHKDRLTYRIVCVNLRTGREIVCRSPQRLRALAGPVAQSAEVEAILRSAGVVCFRRS